MLDFLPAFLQSKILSEYKRLCEVRLRAGMPVMVVYDENGHIKRKLLSNAVTKEQIEECVMRLCDYSLYSVEYALKNGYITSKDGERVGICGECVKNASGQITSLKNFTSLCIRFPQGVKGCSDDFFNAYFNGTAKSCLVFSPPFQGKTTFIRDLGRNCAEKLSLNVLYIDERNEFAIDKAELGNTYDVIKYADKEFGFGCAVRTLNPDVVICDELTYKNDFLSVVYCGLSGVKVIASTHCDTIDALQKILINHNILQCFTFDVFVKLKGFAVDGVYDRELKKI